MELTPPGLHLAKSSAVKSATVMLDTAVTGKSPSTGTTCPRIFER